MAAHAISSEMYCGTMGSRNSVVVGRPIPVISSRSRRAVFNPVSMSCEPSRCGSLINPFQPIVVRGFSKRQRRERTGNKNGSGTACTGNMPTTYRSSISARSILSFVAVTLAFAGCSGGGGTTAVTPPTPVLTSVGVTSPAQSVVAGQTLQLTATPRDQSGNAFSATVTWVSSAPTVATVSSSGLVLALVAGSTTITATATSGTLSVQGSTQITVTAHPVLTSVSVSAASTSLVAGTTLQLIASPKDQNGAAVAATVTWGSSAQGVATVSASGLVTGVAVGSVTITATATSGTTVVTGPITLTVTPAQVLTTVTITAPATTISTGATTQLSASTKDQFGAAIVATVTWSSSAPGTASVSGGSGLVTGVAGGTATITASATAGGVTVTANVLITVVPPVLTTVTINAPATSVAVPGTIQLTATTKDQNGAVIAATVTWSSSASGIAGVGSTTGLVTGVAAGSATITASATAGGVTVTSSVQITVTQPPVLTSVTISAAGSSVSVGGTLQFTASPKDQNGSAIAATLTWNSSVPANATISNSGLVTGVGAGTTSITVSATAGGVTKGSAPTVVTVTAISYPASAAVNATLGLTFSPSSVDIAAGGMVTWNFATTHNVTFNPMAGAPADIPNTSSGSAAATFSIAGTFNYRCTIHAGMTGVVVVH